MNNLNNRLKNTTLTNKQQSKLQMKFKVENEMIKIENKNKKTDKKWGKMNRENEKEKERCYLNHIRILPSNIQR
jgi:hypothetical protein